MNAPTRLNPDGIKRFSIHKGNGLPYPYLQYLPGNSATDIKEKIPLVLFLHGAGEAGSRLSRILVHGLPRRIANGDDFPFVFIAPQAPPEEGWDDALLNKLLDNILVANPRIDRNRVCLTGVSMGGFTTWEFGMTHPEEFAALVPMSAGGDTARVGALRPIPIWVFHGAKDTTAPLRITPENREQHRKEHPSPTFGYDADMVDALKKIHADVQFTVYPNASHDCWEEAYGDPKLYEWLLKQSRNK